MPVAVVLFAASLHASWNALVKPATDRLALMAVMGAASFAICLPTALLVAAPARASWPEIAVSALVHSVYNLLLIASYREGEFNQLSDGEVNAIELIVDDAFEGFEEGSALRPGG